MGSELPSLHQLGDPSPTGPSDTPISDLKTSFHLSSKLSEKCAGEMTPLDMYLPLLLPLAIVTLAGLK